MNPSFAPSFRHRENQDGSWDSICMRCYLTAAHSYSEQPLATVECGHSCDESGWLFKEPAAPPAPRLPSPGHTCPPSAMPRFAHPPARIYFGRQILRRHSGQPADLRESVPFEIGGGL